jgi:hypothetical protein
MLILAVHSSVHMVHHTKSAMIQTIEVGLALASYSHLIFNFTHGPPGYQPRYLLEPAQGL